MDTSVDLHDIQGNIIKAYARFSMIRARYVFFTISKESAGRQFVGKIAAMTTTAAKWKPRGDVGDGDTRPAVTTNIAFTYGGLVKLGIPQKSLQSFPEDFAMGMAARQDILGDDGPSDPDYWDSIWRDEDRPVHIWLSINAATEAEIEERYQTILLLAQNTEGGVEHLTGHSGPNPGYQSAGALLDANGLPTPKEHFGYTDGISDPFFKGSGSNPANVLGGGKPTGKDPATLAGWVPLETGEFILGYRDEAYEYPQAPIPPLLSMNGTFMVYRKLHENVGKFNEYIDKVGADPHFADGGREKIAAKFAGRWRNGAPLTLFPTQAEADAFAAKFDAAQLALYQASDKASRAEAQKQYSELQKDRVGFDFNEDLDGGRCPVGAHIRRTNPRGSLEYGVKGAYNTPGALVNRRRILRRGLPYGKAENPTSNDGDHGIIFMALNASIERQFEFVQQQWLNYGNDFKLANDKDPLLGNHGMKRDGSHTGRMVVESPTDGDSPPYFCSGIPRLVETRGGDYFFIPSITCLHMIASGIIDPT